jgi:FlgD Ig-like domain
MFVLALLGGTAVAFAVTETLKVQGLPLTGPRFTERFSPVCGCDTGGADLSLRFRVSDTVDAVIVDSEGEPVKAVAEERRVRRGRVRFEWDGRDEQGRFVPDGPYRLRVHLDEEHRTILIPNEVEVDTKPPTVRVVRVRPAKISPDDDRRGDRVRVVYRASERSAPTLLVDGSELGSWKARRMKSFVVWEGAGPSGLARSGPHELAVRVRDEAGNLSVPSEPVTVRVRFVELGRSVLRVERGGRLRAHVDADARSFQWSLRRVRHGKTGAALLSGTVTRQTLSVRLPPRLRPGRYVLRVAVAGHSARAVVLVRRPT